jgi:cytochrome c biogenesis protein ResB
VDFAVLQISVLALLAVVGMTLRQLPGFAFRSPTDYANEMDKLHARYDPVLGTGVVDALDRLQLFHVFSSTWFSIGLVVLIISIVACTIDRTRGCGAWARSSASSSRSLRPRSCRIAP